MTPDDRARAGYIEGLRRLADVLEAHPEVPLPMGAGSPNAVVILFHDRPGSPAREAMAAAVRAVGSGTWDKKVGDQFLDLHGKLAGLGIELSAEREAVCTRRVTGTHEVTTDVPDPDLLAKVPLVEVTETVEDVEWDCTPILGGAS